MFSLCSFSEKYSEIQNAHLKSLCDVLQSHDERKILILYKLVYHALGYL